MIGEIQNVNLFDIEHTIAEELFLSCIYPFEILEKIREFILGKGQTLSKSEFYSPRENVWISKSASIADSAYIGDGSIICENACVRHGAFVRGNAIVGRNAVVGNSTEIKNSILFDNVQAPHYNYIGDSILGFCAHMGAGAVTSNIKSDKSNVVIRGDGFEIPTNLRKCGAFLGDYVEVGCNCVLNPGCVVGVGSRIYPLCSVRGVVRSGIIYKSNKEIKVTER